MDGPLPLTAAGPGSDPGAGALTVPILDHVAQPVWVVDRAGLIRFANPLSVRR